MIDHPIDRMAEPQTGVVADRRRPGPRNEVAPDMIPLFRLEFGERVSDRHRPDAPGRLSAARGIGLALAISGVLWVLIGLAVFELI